MATWFRSFAGETTTTPPADTTKRGDAGATWTVESDGNALDNRVIYNDRASQNTWKIISFDGAGSPGGVVEALILTRFDGTTGSPRTGVIIHGSGSDDNSTLNGYMAYLDRSATQGRLRLGRWDNSSLTVLANATAFSFNGGNDLFYIRIQHNGTAIRARWWRAQDNEPGSWTLSSNDTTYSSGWIAYANTQVNTSQAIRLDAVGVGTGGDPAPMVLPTITPDPVAVDGEQIDIAFNTIPHGSALYDLRWSTDDATWTTISGVSTPYQHTDLTPSTTYYYQARMRLGAFTGDWSASESATTPGGGPPAVEADARLGAVAGIRASISVDRQLAIRYGIVTGIRANILSIAPAIETTARLGVIAGLRANIHTEQALAARYGIVAGIRANIVVTVPGEDHVAARLGVVAGIRANISVIDNDSEVAARPGVVVGLRATIKVEVKVRARLGVIVGYRAEFQRWRNVSARLGVLVGFRDAYTGPGTGIVVAGESFSPNQLREGDSFNVVLPWAGLQGMSGLAQVRSRTMRDDRDEQDITLDVAPQPDPRLVPRMAGGGRPGIQPVRSDIARRVARQERAQDRIERERSQ